MEQNNMLKHSSIIGLIISLTVTLISCDRGDNYRYNRSAEYHFVNETNYNISYPTPYNRFNIAPKSTTIIKESIYIGSSKMNADASDYTSPLASEYATNSLLIKFNNLKCLTDVKENDINSVRNINYYTVEKIAENNFKFTYTFTEADYNRAVACP